MLTLYNVISEDGFIARPDGSEHFIPDALWPITLGIFWQYEVLVMGRKTYDAMQKYPRELLEPFEALPMKRVVVSHDGNFHPKSGYVAARSPEEALALGSNVLVSSGPTLNTFLLRNDLVDMVILHKVPIAIGEGIRPFPVETNRILALVSEVPLEGGVKEMRYKVVT